MVMGIICVIWLIKYKLIPLKYIIKFNKYLFVFTGVLLLSFLISLNQYSQSRNLFAVLYLIRLLLYLFYFIYCSYTLKKNAHLLSVVKRGVLLFAIITAIASFGQYFFYSNLRNLSYLGWDPHQYRIFGLFFDTSVAASIFGLGTLYLLKPQKKIWSKVGITISLILGLLTYSRAYYLAILSVLILFFVKKRKYVWIGLLFGGAVISYFMLPRPQGEGVNLLRTFSIESRKADDEKALKIFVKNPLLGIGYNHINKEVGEGDEERPANHASASYHSSYLIILVTTGIIGLICFVLMVYKFAQISEMSLLYVVFLSIFSLFDNILLHPMTMFLFLSLLAIELADNHR